MNEYHTLVERIENLEAQVITLAEAIAALRAPAPPPPVPDPEETL
jgi:hypothetical protein